MSAVHLAAFRNDWYRPGKNNVWRILWFFAGLPLLRFPLIPSSAFRVWLLRLFGARVGRGVTIKPGVRVKYPWCLSIGNDTWIGEDCWIDCLTGVQIGCDACLSQGSYLCTGNHDWSDPAFGLMLGSITVGDGAWVGAKAVVLPGVSIGQCGIASAGSVVTKSIPGYEIHAGNPAVFVRRRSFSTEITHERQSVTEFINH
jgi:putative colanic acid biosynthesis acetyltransferase WcaF